MSQVCVFVWTGQSIESVFEIGLWRFFKIFKMAAFRHVGFLKVGNFNGATEVEGHRWVRSAR